MTPGPIKNAVKQLQDENRIFSYGISDAGVKNSPSPTEAVITAQPH